MAQAACHGRSTLINRHRAGPCGDGERVPGTALSRCSNLGRRNVASITSSVRESSEDGMVTTRVHRWRHPVSWVLSAR
jgi:hypothetical protein